MPPAAGPAILAAIDGVAPSAPTACGGWTAHDIAAHLAAGAKELADLIEESLDGRPERPTRGFAEREAPFRALDDRTLRSALARENKRLPAAFAALAERSDNPAITFTGTRLTADALTTHSRSEAVIHRWDLVGDDEASEELLSQPGLTAHAVSVLNAMPVLTESADAAGARAAHAGMGRLRVVLRSPGQRDVIFAATGGSGRFQAGPDAQAGAADAVLTMDPASRLLALWGRRSPERRMTADGDPAVVHALESILWPAAVPWPPRRA